MKRKTKHIISVIITLAFAGLFFLFSNCIGRLAESLRDFGLSVAYYFCTLFDIENSITPTVINSPKYPYFGFISSAIPSPFLPPTWEEFKTLWKNYWALFINKENILSYLSFIGNGIYNILYGIIIIVPFIAALALLFKRYLNTHNNDYGKESKPLKIFKRISKRTYRPIKKAVKEYIAFLKENKVYLRIWAFIWSLYFNFFTIIAEFIAYYLYFVVSFDILHIYTQVYKLFFDLWTVFSFIPLWGWGIIAFIVFDKIRKKIAYSVLNHFERKNRGYINERPIVYMVCGTMGKKKTTAITDMALSQEAMFRDKAFEKILENDLKFPHFPWINLERELKTAMEYHEVYNLATVRKFIKKKFRRFIKKPARWRIFNYRYKRYPMFYYDNLRKINIWEVLENYAQLYFIYVIESSLIISNYSVRTDGIKSDLGNFPIWDGDFFKRDGRLLKVFSRHSHILDYDMLRLGKKIIEENPKKDSFEFGVVLMTEIGKERGNIIENQGKRKQDESANQKNDLFNSWLKMVRHSATVDNFPFVKVITDEQRPESLGADARELCEIVHIKESGESKLAMPFFSLGELIFGGVIDKFSSLYYNYRYMRSDSTLLLYLIKTPVAKLYSYYTGIYNRFGYSELKTEVESGTQDGILKENKYYLMNKKIYSARFSTDCFSGFFTRKALRAETGIDDMEEYKGIRATFDELKKQNSYFITDLMNIEQTNAESEKDIIGEKIKRNENGNRNT